MPDTKAIPARGDHVRLDVDPREVGLPPATVQQGSRLVVEAARITERGYTLEVRPWGKSTSFHLTTEHVIPEQQELSFRSHGLARALSPRP
jgi:hypothetical protein